VTPQEPLIKAQPFSVPFRIDNTGYFSFFVDHVFLYVHKVKSGGLIINSATDHQPDWNCFVIDRAEARTIITKVANFAPNEADVAIVIDYRPFRHFPPWWSRRYFRFVGAYGDNWQWLKQPSEDIQAAADRNINDHIQKIPLSALCKPASAN
jgi:hypothetical protein